MRRLTVFNHVSLDGRFVDRNGGMSWAHREQKDPEWDAFVAENAGGGGVLVFGRVTYQMMASYWPTPMAAANDAAVAERMNNLQKVVFSRTLNEASWNNTTLVKGDMLSEMRRLKSEPGPDMVILGSGSIVAQFTEAGLIDAFQVVVNPIVLGGGRTMFDGIKENVRLRLTRTRAFANGSVLLCYERPV